MQLSKQEIIRAWKDANFRNQLTAEQRAALPDNPAGFVELSSSELQEVAGGQQFPNVTGRGDIDDIIYGGNRTTCFDPDCGIAGKTLYCLPDDDGQAQQTVAGHYLISK